MQLVVPKKGVNSWLVLPVGRLTQDTTNTSELVLVYVKICLYGATMTSMSGWNNGVFLWLIVTPAAYVFHLRPVNRREALPASFRSERCKREKDCRNTHVIFHSSVTYISSRSLRNDKVCMTKPNVKLISTLLWKQRPVSVLIWRNFCVDIAQVFYLKFEYF